MPDGPYPYFDSVLSGGGFTLGAGYRRFLGDRANWNVAGLYSAKGYKLMQLDVAAPRGQRAQARRMNGDAMTCCRRG